MDITATCWLIAVVLLALIEMATMGLTTIWFAGGAVVAFIAALLGASLLAQVILFLVVSILLLIGTRPFAAKYINQNKENTNVEAIPGKTAVVTEEISNLRGTGYVNLEGVSWMARTEDEMKEIPVGKLVHVCKVSGVKLIVKEEKEEA